MTGRVRWGMLTSVAKSNKFWVFWAIIALAVILIALAWEESTKHEDRLVLDRNGKLTLKRSSVFRSESFNVTHKEGAWWQATSSAGGDTFLPTPYVSRWNGNGYNLILEHEGSLFIVNQSKGYQSEVKWIDGEWMQKEPNSTDEGQWMEINYEN